MQYLRIKLKEPLPKWHNHCGSSQWTVGLYIDLLTTDRCVPCLSSVVCVYIYIYIYIYIYTHTTLERQGTHLSVVSKSIYKPTVHWEEPQWLCHFGSGSLSLILRYCIHWGNCYMNHPYIANWICEACFVL